MFFLAFLNRAEAGELSFPKTPPERASFIRPADGEETGVYNLENRAFEAVDDSFNSSVRQGIRMARQQASIEMLSLPIAGAGAAK